MAKRLDFTIVIDTRGSVDDDMVTDHSIRIDDRSCRHNDSNAELNGLGDNGLWMYRIAPRRILAKLSSKPLSNSVRPDANYYTFNGEFGKSISRPQHWNVERLSIP